ncbi:MAG: cytochrome c biogenesis CcdA family protein [Candidatus Bipolaricaulia bacterium]
MSDLVQLGFAFSAGIAAAFNPCGVVMLPSYISYILGREDGRSYLGGALRGLAAGGVMTAGFFTIFVTFGLLFSYIGRALAAVIPWIVILIGVGLVLLGVLMLAGRSFFQLNLGRAASRLGSLPPKDRVGGLGMRKGYRSFYFYGLAYALASLSCTLPIFLIIVSQTFSSANLLASLLAFVLYAAGMGVVVIIISVATFLSRELLTKQLARLAPYIEKAAALVIIAAGAYLIYYWLSKL